MSTQWTEELKQEVVDRYLEEMEKFDTDEAKAENTTEVVKALAEEFEKTPNGLRMVLTKAEVYVKKVAKTAASSGGASGGGKRISKAEAQAELSRMIANVDEELVDPEIIEKLTGKAAQYFVGILAKVVSE